MTQTQQAAYDRWMEVLAIEETRGNAAARSRLEIHEPVIRSYLGRGLPSELQRDPRFMGWWMRGEY